MLSRLTSPTYDTKSTTNTLKSLAIETRLSIGEMDLSKIYLKYCRFKKFIKMPLMDRFQRKQISTNSSRIKPKEK
jgi:hypothetical protein